MINVKLLESAAEFTAQTGRGFSVIQCQFVTIVSGWNAYRKRHPTIRCHKCTQRPQMVQRRTS